MSHEAQAELVSAYLDGQLEPEEAERFERLLETDPSVREQLEGMRSVVSNLQHLERMAPPSALGQDVARRIALAGEHRSLMDRIEDGLSGMKTQSNVFLMFALIFAFSIIIYFFAMGLQQWREGSRLPVVLSPTPGAAETMSPEVHAAASVLVGGRLFLRAEDGRFVEEGLGAEEVAGARLVDLDSAAGRELLAARPDLQGVALLGHAIVSLEGEVLELCTLPHDAAGAPEQDPEEGSTP